MEGGYVGHETNADCPRPKNKNMLLEVGRPAGRPYILLCRGLLRFARLGASALRAEASARGAMTTACTTAEEKTFFGQKKDNGQKKGSHILAPILAPSCSPLAASWAAVD
jgi:hypothetical protein